MDSQGKSLLWQVFKSSTVNTELSSSVFFKDWFTEHGSAYYFLFKKNLSVTNIQFAELVSLLRVHCTTPLGASIGELEFLSTTDFREWVESIYDSLNPTGDDQGFQSIVDLYSPLFERTIVLDPYYSSCAVYLPPCLKLNLLAVCAYSGYIHSCGPNVFIRKFDKCEKAHLFDSVDKYLKRLKDKDSRIFFAVYSAEDFTEFDRNKAAELKHGLDGVKIDVEKSFMKDDQLVSVLEEMKTLHPRLVIPPPGDFRTIHLEQRQTHGVDRTRTVWLLRDTSINLSNLNHGRDDYFISYEQIFVNGNPFHIFDENKPAWVSHTTMPHTLTAAMINLTRPHSMGSDHVMLVDPFVGTGTTLLEGLKYSGTILQGTDLSLVAPTLASDNLLFFSLPSIQLEGLQRGIQQLKPIVKSRARSEPELFANTDGMVAFYNWTYETLKDVSDIDAVATSALVKDLQSKTLLQRLIFYIGLRARLRYVASYRRGATDWHAAYFKETETLERQLAGFLIARQLQEAPVPYNDYQCPSDIIVYQAKYSLACSLSPSKLQRTRDQDIVSPLVRIQDVRDLSDKVCHVIVTDPPYGFNTTELRAELAQLWTDTLHSIMRAFFEEGQLVISLPDRSHTGRNVKFFTNKEFVTSQVICIANELGKEVIVKADVVPRPVSIFRAPYYWEAEKALRRAILHFIIRKKR